MKRVVFLDRDGVVTAETGEYIVEPGALQILPGACEAIARLNAYGWRVFLFTNQAGVGRGYLSLETLDRIHKRLVEEIERAGGRLEGIYYCPHTPEAECKCRKPKAGLLLQAAQEHGLDLSHCWVLGDSHRDIVAGEAVQAYTGIVLTGHTKRADIEAMPLPHPERVFEDIAEAAGWLCALCG